MEGSSIASRKRCASGEGGSEGKSRESVTTVKQYKDFIRQIRRLLTGELGGKGEMN